MDESVEDGVGESGVASGFVPKIDRQLGRDQGGLRVVAIVENLEQIAAMRVGPLYAVARVPWATLAVGGDRR